MALIGSPTDPAISASVGRVLHQRGSYRAGTALRSAAGTKRLIRIAVTAPASGATFTIRGRAPGVPWVEASFTTTTTNDTDLRAGLIAAWNANSNLRGLAAASAASAGVAMDFEQLWSGPDNPIEIEIVDNPGSDLGTPTVITAGALSFDAVFGRFYQKTGESKQSDVVRPVIAELTAAAGPVDTVTIVVDANGDAFTDVYATPGAATPVTTVTYTADTDTATTVPIAVAAYEAAFPNATVSGVTGTGVITIAHPVGTAVSSISATATNSSTITASVAAGSAVPTALLCVDDGGTASLTIGAESTGYRGDLAPLVVYEGADVSVADPGATVTAGGIVWVETAAGSDKGLPFASASPSRFAHPTFTWTINDTTGTRAVIGG